MNCPFKAAAVNVAEGDKAARILESEAEKQQLINAAEGAARAVIAAGEARAQSISVVAQVGRLRFHRISGKVTIGFWSGNFYPFFCFG